eukprot:8947200-Pyramimonas_sp.AAC.1
MYLCTTRRPLCSVRNSELGPYGVSCDDPIYYYVFVLAHLFTDPSLTPLVSDWLSGWYIRASKSYNNIQTPFHRVETLVRNAVAESKGVLKREDFDSKNISFLSLLEKGQAEKALKEVVKRSKNTKVRNRQ